MFQLTYQVDPAQEFLSRIGAALTQGFPDVVTEGQKLAAHSVETSFHLGGHPLSWAELSDITMKRRLEQVHKGFTPQYALSAPLLWTGALLRAATATTEGVEGSSLSSDGWGFRHEVTLPYAWTQNGPQEEGGFTASGRRIPYRPFFFWQDDDEKALYSRWHQAVSNKIAQA